MAATLHVLRAAATTWQIEFAFDEVAVGLEPLREQGTTFPEAAFAAAKTADGVILGPVSHNDYPPADKGGINPSGALRKRLDLFANIRPAKSRADFPPRCGKPVDLVVVRENTEGFYADRNTFAGTGEYMPTADVAITMGVFTRPAIERIARTAFELARRRRRKLTIVHKANVLQLSSGLFKRVCLEVGESYPDVEVDDFHIDAMTVHLLRRASSFDVVVAENMFGDILSDMAGELAGSLGIAPSINASDDRCMAQAAHGSAPDIAGKGLANPIAMMLSSGMLLDWLGRRHRDQAFVHAAARLEAGVRAAVRGGVATRDLGGTASTDEFTDAVLRGLASP
jgi:3-isopropylmalate dehydrogenase